MVREHLVTGPQIADYFKEAEGIAENMPPLKIQPVSQWAIPDNAQVKNILNSFS